jgi:hypothetical protein
LVFSPTGSINLGFTTEGRLASVLIIPSLGVPNWLVVYINTAPSKTVHKGSRWRLNIKVKEGPFADGSRDCKFYKPPKIMVLTSFELSLPPS